MSNEHSERVYTIGLDLGVASIGWALIGLDDNEQPERIIRAGVHLFEAGVDGGKQDPSDAMASANEKSRALPRREARQQRRQTWRRAYRKRLLLKRLILHGLLPKAEQRLSTPAEIDMYLKEIDATLRKKWEEKQGADHRLRQLLPYRLRAAALHQPLDAYEIGRALYHLAQRRGFLSNRKTDQDDAGDDDKNTGKVKTGITELEMMMIAAEANTLGEFFASLDPSDPESRRIRGRWTARSMYTHEFERIWTEQSTHHPELMTDDAKESIHKAIFYQRPLKSQRHLIGRCSLFEKKRRAPIADRLFQRFRMLQKINDLEIIPQMQIEEEDFDKKTGEVKINAKTGKPKMKKRWVPDPKGTRRKLTEEERQAVINRLSLGRATFTQLRNAGAGPKTTRFNFETESDETLTCHRTDERLRAVFDDRWDSMSETDKDAVVEDCLSFERADAMEKRGRNRWNLSADDARAFARVKLEDGYASFSRSALRQLLPKLEEGVQLQTAIKELFPESFAPEDPVDHLPPLTKAFDEPLSPAVSRALSELRGVLNAIIRRYGKPAHVRIELARELKKGRKRRENISKGIKERTRIREIAKSRLLDEAKLATEPRRDDIEKVLLADECNWHCPYTDRGFGWSDLFGQHPTIQVEHIWPYSRSLDNSFLNKTLCDSHENQNIKRNRTPYEAYSGDRFDEIVQRVSKFKSDAFAVREKLKRFQAETIEEGFTQRHLRETQYISVKAMEYIALLYGGLSDDEHTRRVHATSGGLTYLLRQQWKLHSVLSDRDEKDRSDHRHHAMDAIVVALTTPRTVQVLERAARVADDRRTGRLFAEVDLPFDSFLEDAQRAIGAIVVSHRKNHKARGKFHKDTIYSKTLPAKDGKESRRIRKELHKLNEKQLEEIVDSRIRDVVRKAYNDRKAQGATNFSKAFSDPQHLPQLPHGDRIRRVRIFDNAKPDTVGKGARSRDVDLQSNHHTVIMAKLNKDGSEKTWVDEPVSLFDAMQRVKEGQSLVSKEVPDGYCFKFSLAANDFVELDNPEDDCKSIYRVLSVSKSDIELALHTDGRTSTERKTAKERERIRGSSLFKRKARKVHINYLGEVSNAGG